MGRRILVASVSGAWFSPCAGCLVELRDEGGAVPALKFHLVDQELSRLTAGVVDMAFNETGDVGVVASDGGRALLVFCFREGDWSFRAIECGGMFGRAAWPLSLAFLSASELLVVFSREQFDDLSAGVAILNVADGSWRAVERGSALELGVWNCSGPTVVRRRGTGSLAVVSSTMREVLLQEGAGFRRVETSMWTLAKLVSTVDGELEFLRPVSANSVRLELGRMGWDGTVEWGSIFPKFPKRWENVTSLAKLASGQYVARMVGGDVWVEEFGGGWVLVEV